MENFSTPHPEILVTGANGQLGKELRRLAPRYPSYRFTFTAREDLPVDDVRAVQEYFEKQRVDYCINCAAYTAVDKAETESEKAYQMNAAAVGNLAQACHRRQARLIHISTDYVFNGTASAPYKEDDPIAPVNAYGASKLKGEELAFINNPLTLVIRTSWVYSAFGNNFVKTMIRLMKEKESINVINDQYGCPTYAADLAQVIIETISQADAGPLSGIFNFCNEGIITWYEFAMAIKELINSNCIINPIPSSGYVTAALRPQYSALDTAKIREALHITIPHWKDSLEKCIKEITGNS